MQRKRAAVPAILLATAGLLSGCAGAVSDAYVIENEPGTSHHIAGTELSRVTLTEDAVERLGIDTTPVTATGRHLVVPMSAVFVDTEGAWWVYTNPRPAVYVRHEIEVGREQSGRAILAHGPAEGTEVVTVGVAELYGVEFAVGH